MSITYNFEHKHFLITGASSGIGQQNAWDLCRADASLTLLGRDEKRIDLTKKGLIADKSPEIFIGDLSAISFIEQVALDVQPLDGVVLSAGMIDYTPAKMINKEKIRRVFDVNFDANVLLIQQLLKRKKIKNGASIVIISSISCKLGVPGTALYAASKAAISAYAKVIASELSSKKIRVNTIFPGIVKTNLVMNEGVLSEHELTKAESEYHWDMVQQMMYLIK